MLCVESILYLTILICAAFHQQNPEEGILAEMFPSSQNLFEILTVSRSRPYSHHFHTAGTPAEQKVVHATTGSVCVSVRPHSLSVPGATYIVYLQHHGINPAGVKLGRFYERVIHASRTTYELIIGARLRRKIWSMRVGSTVNVPAQCSNTVDAAAVRDEQVGIWADRGRIGGNRAVESNRKCIIAVSSRGAERGWWSGAASSAADRGLPWC